MKFAFLILSLFFYINVFAADNTPSGAGSIASREDMRLAILKNERFSIVLNLNRAIENSGKISDKLQGDPDDEIRRLKSDLVAIDKEIANTHLPPFFYKPSSKSAIKVVQKPNEKNNDIDINVAEENSTEKKSNFESWDVFQNFNKGK